MHPEGLSCVSDLSSVSTHSNREPHDPDLIPWETLSTYDGTRISQAEARDGGHGCVPGA